MCLTRGERSERVRRYLCTPLIHQQLKFLNSFSHCKVVCVCVGGWGGGLCVRVCVCVCVLYVVCVVGVLCMS